MDFFNQIVTVISEATTYLTNTTAKIDAVNFNDLSFVNYLGYIHYFMGDLAYTGMMGMIVIIAGINIFNFILSAIGKLKNLLPW
jgi:hypothetical protein